MINIGWELVEKFTSEQHHHIFIDSSGRGQTDTSKHSEIRWEFGKEDIYFHLRNGSWCHSGEVGIKMDKKIQQNSTHASKTKSRIASFLLNSFLKIL